MQLHVPGLTWPRRERTGMRSDMGILGVAVASTWGTVTRGILGGGIPPIDTCRDTERHMGYRPIGGRPGR